MREGDQSYILSIDVVDGKTVTPVPYAIAPRPVRCLGVAVGRVFTRTAEAKNLRLKRTRPFRPQTNGKAEAFNKIMQAEWAYQRPYYSTRERLDTLPRFTCVFQSPASARRHRRGYSRLPPVNNFHGNYS